MVTLQSRLYRRLFAGILIFLGTAVAEATTPRVNEVLTAYSAAGTPIGISILGANLCTGSPCAEPTVTLGGKGVSLSAFSATSVTAKLPQPITLGDYTLKVTTAAGSTVFELTLAKLTVGTGAPSVKDSSGQVVGAYIATGNPLAYQPADAVFIRTSTVSFAVGITTSQVGPPPTTPGSLALFYDTPDCTGSAYLQMSNYLSNNQLPMPMIPFAIVVNSTAYIASTTVRYFGPSSALRTDGTCTGASGYGSTSYVLVVATFDISTLNLIPPFSVQ